MTVLDIKIDTKRLSLYCRGLHCNINEDTISLLAESFSKYIRELYLSMILDAMKSRRYKGRWEPSELPEYVEYLGATPVSSIYSIMDDALEVTKVGYSYLIRFEPHYKYPESKLLLVNVLRAIEYGTSEFNARPIMRKIVRSITSHMRVLWNEFLAMRGVV